MAKEFVKATVFRCERGYLMNLKRGTGATKSYSFNEQERMTMLAMLDDALGEEEIGAEDLEVISGTK